MEVVTADWALLAPVQVERQRGELEEVGGSGLLEVGKVDLLRRMLEDCIAQPAVVVAD